VSGDGEGKPVWDCLSRSKRLRSVWFGFLTIPESLPRSPYALA